MSAHEEAPGLGTEGDSNTILEDINLGFDTTDPGPHGGEAIYARGAQLYRNAGWRAPLPLPPTSKSPPPKGFTGYDGQWPDDGQIEKWINESSPASNLMLRVDYGVVGIDVDAY